jgi:hypothetical protein
MLRHRNQHGQLSRRNTASLALGACENIASALPSYARDGWAEVNSVLAALGWASLRLTIGTVGITCSRQLHLRAEVAAPITEVDAHIAAAMPSASMAHQEPTSFADEY